MEQLAKDYFNSALLGVGDDDGIVYALVLDSLYSWSENGESSKMLEDILIQHEDRFTAKKLEGVIRALLEFQLTYPIPEYLMDRIFKLVHSHISDGQPEDKKWILMSFGLMGRAYGFKRLRSLIGLALGPVGIPEMYLDVYWETVRTYLKMASVVEENYGEFISEFERKIKNRIDKNERTDQENIGCLKRLMKIIEVSKVERSGVDEVGESKSVIQVLNRFRQCCQYVKEPPRGERDVQDIVWVILRSHFDRLEREEILPKFGTKGYRPDFGIPELRLLVEVKYIGDGTKVANIQEEILADVPGYLGEQTRYNSLLVLIYDAAQKLRDPLNFIADLKKVEGIMEVIVVPGIG